MADEVRVWFVCGCTVQWDPSTEDPPICDQHQERRIRRVVSPKPRFVMKES